MDQKFESVCKMCMVALSAPVDVDLILANFSHLASTLISLLSSALACRRAQNLFVKFTSSVMPATLNNLGNLHKFELVLVFEFKFFCFMPSVSLLCNIAHLAGSICFYLDQNRPTSV